MTAGSPSRFLSAWFRLVIPAAPEGGFNIHIIANYWRNFYHKSEPFL